MATLIASYSEANVDSTGSLRGPILRVDIGQAFINPTSVTLDSCKFFLKIKNGGPLNGDMTALLYAVTGTPGTDGKPTGAILATSDIVNESVLTGTFALITFNFSGAQRITLAASTNYIIMCRADGTADVSDIAIGYDASSPTGTNQNYAEGNGVSWSGFSTIDTAFYIYAASPVSTANFFPFLERR